MTPRAGGGLGQDRGRLRAALRLTFTPPRPIDEQDVLTPFDCGIEGLNQWLAQRALRAHRRGSARTYVVVGDDGLLAGYLALAATGIGRQRCRKVPLTGFAATGRKAGPCSTPTVPYVLARRGM